MSETSVNNKRIAKNTIFLFIRTIFIMLITLYCSRVILRALGVIDYGIYNVVGGFVTMFSVISNSLTAAISRFITYELGRGDIERLNRIFSAALKTQFFLAFIIFVIIETFGNWFLNTQMVFPPDRASAANWVFQFSILTFLINLVSVPYNACIIAHEHMKAFAYFGIFQAMLSLVASLLISMAPIDKLVFYSALMTLAAILIRLFYGLYCSRNFKECHFHWKTDKGLTIEIMRFAGWNFIGAASGMLRDQGINVVLNLFCGPVVNAARGIAMQVSTAIRSFAGNFTTAINPQITKNYAAGNCEQTFKLVFQGSRFSYYLMLLWSLPILMETEFVLQLWLGIVPEYTIIFVRLIIIYSLTECISNTMITLMLATGDIKKYQIIVGGCQMLNLPVAYLLMYIGCSPESTFLSSIAIAVACLCLRLYMLQGMVQLPVKRFLHSVLLKDVQVSFFSSLIPLFLIKSIEMGVVRFIFTCLLCFASSSIVVLYLGCSVKERTLIFEKIRNVIQKK